MSRKGFTLLELIIVIVILGIIAVMAVPYYIDLSYEAALQTEKATVASIMTGITNYRLEQILLQ